MTSQKSNLIRGGIFVSAAMLLALTANVLQTPARANEGVVLPPPAVDAPGGDATTETAVFAGGCFWGVQAVFQHVKGVKRAVSGYSGGTVAAPSYEQVTTGSTGHAESVEIVFDPREVSYGKLMQVFFSVAHDPTQLNYQGPDRGTQYRSAIFYNNQAQRDAVEAYIAQLTEAKAFEDKIVTEVAPMMAFYPAEDYHQDYFINNPDSAYIQINDVPKVKNLERFFPDLYRSDPVTVAEAAS
jgi:peptide-methionine (S)-S-oxide reductase